MDAKSRVMNSETHVGRPANSEETRLLKETIILVSTTFVETDSYSFKELVHKLTGVSDDSEEEKLPVTSPSSNSKKASASAGWKSSGGSHGFMKSGIKVGSQKFKHQRRKGHKRAENHLDLTDPHNTTISSAGKGHNIAEVHLGLSDPHSTTISSAMDISNALPPSPIIAPGPADPHTCSSTSYCCNHSSCSHSTPPSVSQSSYLEEEEQEFCFQPSPVSEKREPKLLALFPLYSMNV
ncbi:hypothetical protein SUGI_0325080 [Cryptomeria japonica]|nr:hypothetical protein SUGI_0325080 [Cryptomeria japonica]